MLIFIILIFTTKCYSGPVIHVLNGTFVCPQFNPWKKHSPEKNVVSLGFTWDIINQLKKKSEKNNFFFSFTVGKKNKN